jgi:hypothetical protein
MPGPSHRRFSNLSIPDTERPSAISNYGTRWSSSLSDTSRFSLIQISTPAEASTGTSCTELGARSTPEEATFNYDSAFSKCIVRLRLPEQRCSALEPYGKKLTHAFESFYNIGPIFPSFRDAVEDLASRICRAAAEDLADVKNYAAVVDSIEGYSAVLWYQKEYYERVNNSKGC